MIDTSPTHHSFSALSADPGEFLEHLRTAHQPVTLTVDGRPEFVIQEAAAYKRLLALAAWAEEEQSILAGLDDIEHGRTTPAEEVFERLRAKHNILR